MYRLERTYVRSKQLETFLARSLPDEHGRAKFASTTPTRPDPTEPRQFQALTSLARYGLAQIRVLIAPEKSSGR